MTRSLCRSAAASQALDRNWDDLQCYFSRAIRSRNRAFECSQPTQKWLGLCSFTKSMSSTETLLDVNRYGLPIKQRRESRSERAILNARKTRQSYTADFAPELYSLIICRKCCRGASWRVTWSMLPVSGQYAQAWRHPQNRKYVTYRSAARKGPSHRHR